MHLHAGFASAERVGQGKWVEGNKHMVPARLGCKSIVVGTEWANAYPGCMDRLRKCYSHLVGAGKATWGSWGGCLMTNSADHCMLVNEWALLRSRVWFLRLEVDLGSALESELGQK